MNTQQNKKKSKTNMNNQPKPLMSSIRTVYRTRAGSTKKNKTMRMSKMINTTKSDKLIVLTFLEMLNTVKLYHWKTMSHSTHKATDELYSKLNENIDTFVETMLGKNGRRLQLSEVKSIPLYDFNDVNQFKKKIESYKSFLINLNLTNNSDLLNVRDEMLGNLNQFTYLLTFK